MCSRNGFLHTRLLVGRRSGFRSDLFVFVLTFVPQSGFPGQSEHRGPAETVLRGQSPLGYLADK